MFKKIEVKYHLVNGTYKQRRPIPGFEHTYAHVEDAIRAVEELSDRGFLGYDIRVTYEDIS